MTPGLTGPTGNPSRRCLACCLLGVLCHVVLLALPLLGQLDEDEFRPGLIAHYTDQAGNPIRRVDRSLSFIWDGRAAGPPAAGRFRVRWQGYLMSQATGQYQFKVYAAGEVGVRLNGQLIIQGQAAQPTWMASPPMRLPFDWHPLEIDYRANGEGPSRFSLYWSGPKFQLEPISQRQLFHDPQLTPEGDDERGEALIRALRCSACHRLGAARQPLPAPALDQLPGNLQRPWLVHWLTSVPSDNRRGHMPSYGMSMQEATAIAALLLHEDPQPGTADATGPQQSDRLAGERLFLTTGCLACHRVGQLGESGLFGGGDLSDVASKRTGDFFARWLAEPAAINRHHRMPTFDLSAQERTQLVAYLSSLRQDQAERPVVARPASDAAHRQQGRLLLQRYGCQRCHALAEEVAAAQGQALPLSDSSNWQHGCTGQPDPARARPGFGLSAEDRRAVRSYIARSSRRRPAAPGSALAGRQLLAENNCLACHAREVAAGLADKLPAVAEAHPELAPLLPAMTPPSLIAVGDKLHDQALRDAMQRTSAVHRPWLHVRMPRFRLDEQQLQSLVRYFVEIDRIPTEAQSQRDSLHDNPSTLSAAARLVSTDGFGCTSCHQVGKVKPPKAPLNTVGPDLLMLGKRIRRPWFDRWVRNPARIIPRMEMPSVEIPVRGVLGDKLDAQLSAVWLVLNKPTFTPPEPNPVRVVRRSGLAERGERAVVITDVLHAKGNLLVKPLLIGLPNRHNVLLDLGSARLAQWWIGDVARQRTKGKSWFWEAAGDDLLDSGLRSSDLVLMQGATVTEPAAVGQFATEMDALEHRQGGVRLSHRLHFPLGEGPTAVVRVQQSLTPLGQPGSAGSSGFRRDLEIRGIPQHASIALRVVDPARLAGAERFDDGRIVQLPSAGGVRVRILSPPSARIDPQGSIHLAAAGGGSDAGHVSLQLEYLTDLSVDQFPVVPPQIAPPEAVRLHVVPGFQTIRLPLTEEIMPTALTWRPDGVLAVASLKGRVWLARDTDGDGLEDQIDPFSDELAAPFGLAAGKDYLDVVAKYALLRLYDDDQDGQSDRMSTLASGWGHTADYHDWAIGLPRDTAGNYYISLPCQQDERSQAAARLRGTVLKLVRRSGDAEDPRRFDVQQISAGHRFPMGIARNRQGALFVTDNQGNYNPFNELNHVLPGARYGFINRLERSAEFRPQLTPPAIDIPHPWTRSVNGICFLETPAEVQTKLGRPLFGPFEGHLVGCEYDTRRLIRMSLQKVGDTYQGASYPFSLYHSQEGPMFLGPLVCAVAPSGDLYVGCIRDSGWGGANNIGSLVRLRHEPDQLPAGIAEVRAFQHGLVLDFTGPVSVQRASDPKNYSVSSYRRISTPAYGGPDVDRRVETIADLKVSADGRNVVLDLQQLREGFLYEIRVRNLAGQGVSFFPAEAYYTLRRIPRHSATSLQATTKD